MLKLSQLDHTLAVPSERDLPWLIGLFSNKPMLGAVVLLLQLAVVLTPPLQPIFKSTDLTATELAVCPSLPLIVLIAVESEKGLVRRGLVYSSSDRM